MKKQAENKQLSTALETKPTKSRHYLAKMYEKKKIREYNTTPTHEYPGGEKQKAAIQTVNALVSFLGVMETEGDGKKRQHFMVQQFMLSDYSRFAFEEVTEAFKLAMKGEYDGMKSWKNTRLVAKLDCNIFGRVMKCYDVYKKQNAPKKRTQPPKKELTESEKTAVENRCIEKCKAEFKKTGEVPSGYSFVWDILAKRGLVDDSKGFKLTLIGHAKKQESMRKKGLAEVIRNNEKRYVSIAKRIGIENYFKKNTEKVLRNK